VRGSPLSRLRPFGIGLAWGLAGAGLVVAHLRLEASLPIVALGAVAGGILALLRPDGEALRHPWMALVAAGAGWLMARPFRGSAEPAFFLLVPLLAAAVAWPLRRRDEVEGIPRAAPAWALPATFLTGAAVFFFQSANRFWSFGAGAKDLGLFYQTHWLIAHGLAPLNTVMGMHALADHMELVDYPVALLLRLHAGPETLLLVQSLALASAVFPLAWLGNRLLESSRAGLALAWLWLLQPDVHMGVMFDYNPTQLGSAGLLWTAWALFCRGPGAALPAALATCLTKENICLYVAVLAAVLAFRGRSRRQALLVMALALATFAVEMLVVFPRFREDGFRHWEFEELGETPAETAVAAVKRPQDVATLLLDHPQKRRSLLLPLAGTGYVGLADPFSLVLQIPNWAERFLSTHRTRWWGYHYGVPAAAMAMVGLLLGWRRLREANRDGRRLPIYLLVCALLVGTLPPYRTPGGNRRSDLYQLHQPYVAAPEDVATQRRAVAFIERLPQSKLAAQDRLLPHLAGRPEVYMLERAIEADVVALQMNGATWPDGRPTWKRRIRDIWGSGRFAVVFCEGQTVVLRRGAPPGIPCPAFQAQVESAVTTQPAPDVSPKP
jgi:uncharacterized membrane protein